MKLDARSHFLKFPTPAIVMGVVNLSSDSFSGEGCADASSAMVKALSHVADGAQIIDVGAESARTNRAVISEQEEIDRLLAFLQSWNEAIDTGRLDAMVILSINTWRATVARTVLGEGGDILNDIGGLSTDENARICAATGTALVIMHTVGQPKVPHTHVQYGDVMHEMEAFFAEKIRLAEAVGLKRDSIILDPGIDFAKQRDDNLRIYRELTRLQCFERPILLPVSRKTVIGDVLGIPPSERDPGTVACGVAGLLRGANILRVHNVRAAMQAIRVVHAVENSVDYLQTS